LPLDYHLRFVAAQHRGAPCPTRGLLRKLAPDGDAEDGCHPQEVQALKQYLCKEISAREAARAITQPASENPAERLQPFWGFLVDALVELPSEHTSTLNRATLGAGWRIDHT